MLNAVQFSTAKDVATNGMMKTQLFDSDGVRKGFSEFKNDCKAITDITNETWIRVEYDTAVRQVVAGQQFKSFQEDSDLYGFWQYLETTSAHPRDEHLLLVGNIYKIGDPESDDIFPPNGFNCLPKGSLIQTKDGWEEIQNLKVNQTIIGGSGNECNITIVHKNFFSGQLMGIVKKDSEVFYTENHRILTIKGWVRSDSINSGDIVINNREKGFTNAIISYVKNCYSFGRNVTVPFIIKRQTGMIKRLNSYIINWYKNVNPISTTIKIMDCIKGGKETHNNSLVFSGAKPGIDMHFRMQGIEVGSGLGHFSPNFGSSRRSANFELFRNNFKMFTIFFGFTNIWMRNACNIISHSLTCILFPFIIVYPLYLYCIAIASDWYIKFFEHCGDSSIIANIPTLHKIANTLKLNRIKFIKDNGSGSPLDKFNSFGMYLYSCFSHNSMGVIAGVNIVNHNDYVYNLTVENDVSYITKTGIVHNCSCSAEQVDDQGLKDSGKTPRTNEEAGEDLKNGVPEQFRFNPYKSGILPKESHSYFQALPSANSADGETFGITGTTKNSDKLSAKGMHLMLKMVDQWKHEHHGDHNTITFQNEATLSNIKFTHKALLTIEKHSAGFEQLADTVTKPGEIWSSWINVKEQLDVKRVYIKGNYCVMTINGNIIDAYLVDNINRFRKGCIILI